MAARGEAQADVEVSTLVVPAWQLRWRAPELALVLGERAVALASARRDEVDRLRAEALVVFASNRMGRGVRVADRALDALKAAEAAGEQDTAWRLRVELADSARSVGAPLTGFAAVRPVLEADGVPPALRAAALVQASQCLVTIGRGAALADALEEADRLYAADRDTEPDATILSRCALRAAAAAQHRRWGDLDAAVATGREGLELLAGLSDPSADNDQVRARLTLELACALMDSDHLAEASELGTPLLERPVRAPSAATLGWLRLALATRVHLPAGRVDQARGLLRDAAHSAERHQLDTLLAESLLALAHVHEVSGELAEALANLRSAHAAERRRARAVYAVRARLAAEFSGVHRRPTALHDQLASLLRPDKATAARDTPDPALTPELKQQLRQWRPAQAHRPDALRAKRSRRAAEDMTVEGISAARAHAADRWRLVQPFGDHPSEPTGGRRRAPDPTPPPEAVAGVDGVDRTASSPEAATGVDGLDRTAPSPEAATGTERLDRTALPPSQRTLSAALTDLPTTPGRPEQPHLPHAAAAHPTPPNAVPPRPNPGPEPAAGAPTPAPAPPPPTAPQHGGAEQAPPARPAFPFVGHQTAPGRPAASPAHPTPDAVAYRRAVAEQSSAGPSAKPPASRHVSGRSPAEPPATRAETRSPALPTLPDVGSAFASHRAEPDHAEPISTPAAEVPQPDLEPDPGYRSPFASHRSDAAVPPLTFPGDDVAEHVANAEVVAAQGETSSWAGTPDVGPAAPAGKPDVARVESLPAQEKHRGAEERSADAAHGAEGTGLRGSAGLGLDLGTRSRAESPEERTVPVAGLIAAAGAARSGRRRAAREAAEEVPVAPPPPPEAPEADSGGVLESLKAAGLLASQRAGGRRRRAPEPEPETPLPAVPGPTTPGVAVPAADASGPATPGADTHGPAVPGAYPRDPAAPGVHTPGPTAAGAHERGPAVPRADALGSAGAGAFAPGPVTPPEDALGPTAADRSARGPATPGAGAPSPGAAGAYVPDSAAPGAHASGPGADLSGLAGSEVDARGPARSEVPVSAEPVSVEPAAGEPRGTDPGVGEPAPFEPAGVGPVAVPPEAKPETGPVVSDVPSWRVEAPARVKAEASDSRRVDMFDSPTMIQPPVRPDEFPPDPPSGLGAAFGKGPLIPTARTPESTRTDLPSWDIASRHDLDSQPGFDASAPPESSTWSAAAPTVPPDPPTWSAGSTPEPARAAESSTWSTAEPVGLSESSGWSPTESTGASEPSGWSAAESAAPSGTPTWSAGESARAPEASTWSAAEAAVPPDSSTWSAAEAAVPPDSSTWSAAEAAVPPDSSTWT
ncbi:hypothetical protein, partial [Actinosynnema sp. NPDC020468]|uniref:hypothetical protein n=1 Tax=Actinosynnema sp. NPDC020468 TaxID=3154488 RepID=UPI0033C87951